MLAIPIDGLPKAVLERERRPPAQLAFALTAIDGIAAIVAGTIGNITDQRFRFVQGVEQSMGKLQIGAFGAAAESGTLMLVSGADNPTTLNFLPDTHIVVIDAKDVAGDYETLWRRLREKFGDGVMPRTVNFITGPSRSADIEQTLILGAHGPRRLHVMVVGKAEL